MDEPPDSPCAAIADMVVDILNEHGISALSVPVLERTPSQELMIDVWEIPTAHDRERIHKVWEQNKQLRAIKKMSPRNQ